MTNSILDIEEADCILIIGSNTFEQHPLIARRVIKAKENGTKIIVIDPRYTHTAKQADKYLQLVPGSNTAMLNGIMHVIIKENLIDEEFIKNRTKNYEELKKTVEKYTPEYVSKITHVPAEDIEEVARMYASANAASLLYCMGITQFIHGVNNVKSCCNLAMITGNMGRPGTGVNPLRGQNNVQGACDMGALPNVYPGYQNVTATQEKFQEAWKTDLDPNPGFAIPDMLDEAGKKIKCLYVMGENPMVSDPDLNHVKHALGDLDLLIVQDLFLTETAQIADVVLPGVSWAEKDGTFSNTERRVQRVHKAVEPLEGAMVDWEIVKLIGEKMGHPELFEFNTPEEVFNEITSVTPQYAGMTYDRLGVDGLHWPCKTPEDPGTPILHKEKFLTADGLGVMFPIEYGDPAELPDAEYPMILTTGRVIFHYHTGTMTRRSKHLDEELSEGFIEIHPEDAKEMGIKDKQSVKATTRRGEVVVKARITPNIKRGVVFMPFHFAEAAANTLTNPAQDPNCKIPEYKVCAVKIEKA
ncbi:formate dehydrogenase major subunit [Methanococcus voltae]|uniref:Formate dehydrogenase major subunit n=4 Tax=Methanococcus voltae TaxID=2188 RepID=A0A8J7RHU5_METVO|nr:formate dehydrogenase major subunit [Methanococcus voltae]